MKRDLLAPLEPPHPFGGKRPALELDYYEQFNKPNVHIVDTGADPIAELTRHGIVTKSGRLCEVDAIALATGFDASTGGLVTSMGIKDIDGVQLGERWKHGVLSFLGIMVPGFPNMFVPYGPQSPAGFTNGPMFIDLQSQFIRDVIRRLEESSDIKHIEPRPELAQAWRREVLALGNMDSSSSSQIVAYGG